MSSVVTCFSKPSGISDFLEAAISSMSSRRMTCRLASASISSTEVLVSDGEQAVDHAAVVGGDGVLDEVALDASARVEDVGQELVAGQGGDARQVGADLAALAAVAVALGALLLRRRPCRWMASPPSLSSGREPVDHLLAVGVGQAAALARAATGPARRSAVSGCADRACFWSSASSESRSLALLEGVDQGRGPVGPAEQGSDRQGPRRPGPGPAGARPGHCPTRGPCSGRRRRAGRRPARASVPGVIDLQQLPGDARRSAARSSTSCLRRIDPARLGELLVLGRGQQRARRSRRRCCRRPGCPRGPPAGRAAPCGAEGSSIGERLDAPSPCSRRAGRACPWASRGPARG